ncbi:MAG: hypothetical protein OXK81_02530 [Chloroflexota bacterium]|nr:hypothetical protein [Chloroflexota bacterium]MDE2930830.1 hypothetical protein [Chloroflexota bacterium]
MSRRQDSNYQTEELRKALEHLDRRAVGTEVLQETRRKLDQLPKLNLRDKGNRENRAHVWVSLVEAMYAAGRVTKAEYTHLLAIFLIMVHQDRWFDGDYDADLKPISDQIVQIERAHGLTEDEYWPPGEGPPEHEALNRNFEAILDREQGHVFREFGKTWLANLWEQERERFDELFEEGRVSFFESGDQEDQLTRLIQVYEREAQSCVEVSAFYAACASLGAAMEARLLLHCLKNPGQAQAAFKKCSNSKRVTSRFKRPMDWNLDSLLKVCAEAGWLSPIESDLGLHFPEGWGHHLRDLRNLLHPSRHLRTRPRGVIGREEYDDAHAAYMLLKSQLGLETPRESIEQGINALDV